MATPNVSQLVAQTVVYSDGSGASVRASQLSAQLIIKNLSQAMNVSQLTAQAVTSALAKGVNVSELDAQVVIQNSAGGGKTNLAKHAAQVVYSTGAPFTTRSLAWTYTLDGHTMYVLDLGANGSLVYDQATEQWTHFNTNGYDGHWNFKNGWDWETGKNVVGGDIQTGELYAMATDSFFDEDFRPVTYEVNGALFITDQRYHRMFYLRCVGGAGKPILPQIDGPKLNMVFSDDNGESWSTPVTVDLVADTRQRIEFRSLGAFTSPGRIIRLYDDGGIKYLAYCVANVEE